MTHERDMRPLIVAHSARVSLQLVDVDRAIAQEVVGASKVTLEGGGELEEVLVPAGPSIIHNTLRLEPKHQRVLKHFTNI